MDAVKKPAARVTLKDIAAEAGVGLMTVSRVVNNHPGKKISPATAARVRAVIDRLGYEPNHVARALRGQKSGTIGLVITDVGDPFCSQCARGVEAEARRRGYVTMLMASEEDPELEDQQISALSRKQVDGLLIVPSVRERRSAILENLKVPVVAFDRPLDGIESDCVLIQNAKAAKMLTSHLIEHGHRRIAFVGYGPQIFTVQKRIDGYRKAMTERGLSPQIDVSAAGPAAAKDHALRMLSSDRPPAAMVALNSLVLHGILQASEELGRTIPKDLAVVGFDDFEWASFVGDGLTLVRQPAEEIGRRAAELLFDRIGNQASDGYKTVMLEAPLVIRQSCGCPAEA